jgi:hypothetical protein
LLSGWCQVAVKPLLPGSARVGFEFNFGSGLKLTEFIDTWASHI